MPLRWNKAEHSHLRAASAVVVWEVDGNADEDSSRLKCLWGHPSSVLVTEQIVGLSPGRLQFGKKLWFWLHIPKTFKSVLCVPSSIRLSFSNFLSSFFYVKVREKQYLVSSVYRLDNKVSNCYKWVKVTNWEWERVRMSFLNNWIWNIFHHLNKLHKETQIATVSVRLSSSDWLKIHTGITNTADLHGHTCHHGDGHMMH